MNETVLHSIADRIIGVSLEKLGYEISSHENLVAIASDVSKTLISESPEADLALNSEGSDLLKAFLICKCIALVYGCAADSTDSTDSTESEYAIAACAATSAKYFLIMGAEETNNEPDTIKKSADLLLVSLANELFNSN